jgi:hypothetical protein
VLTVQARPYRVVEHSADLIALYQPEGTPLPRWLISEQRYLPEVARSRGESIRLLFPKKEYDATLFFDTAKEPPWFFSALFEDEGLLNGWRQRRPSWETEGGALTRGQPGRFRGWYVNFQSCPIPRPYGFDLVDHTLDIVVRPDLSWYWKDEDELQLALDKGALDQQLADSIRATGEEVVKLIDSRATPFDNRWTEWHSSHHPSWPAIEGFPDGWQNEPALLPDTWV